MNDEIQFLGKTSQEIVNHAREYSKLADFDYLTFNLYQTYLIRLCQGNQINSSEYRLALKAIEILLI